MKIINLIEEGRVGGPQLRILRLTPHLQSLEVETTVVLPKCSSSDFQQRLTDAGIQFCTISLTTMQKHPKRLFVYSLKFFPELYYLTRLIMKQNPDLVHVSGGSWQIKGVLAGRLARRKVIWHLNDTHIPKVLKLLFRVLQPLSHAFITAGYRVQKYYLPNERKRRIFNISAPVDCSVFDPALFHKTSSDDVLRIVTIANVNPTKGLENYLEMAAILNKKVENSLEFRIVGSVYDSQRKYFEKLRNLKKKLKLNNLVFVGRIDDPRKELVKSDIYVCTSLKEGSPTSVWEALAMGIPTVTTNVGEVDHIIENDISGLVCESNDAQELAAKIEYLLLNREITEEMGKQARARATKLLDVVIVAKKYCQAYQEIIDSE